MFQKFDAALFKETTGIYEKGLPILVNTSQVLRIEPYGVDISILVFPGRDLFYVWHSLDEVAKLIPMLVRVSQLSKV